ncbi:MAG TPA: nitrogenase component 1 [Myxococcota bacterium]|nr:nitrogenase component 1 [Myxococcota bacterium]
MPAKKSSNIHDFDPADGRRVVGALSILVNDALGGLVDGGWRCLRAMPRIDGTLYFDLRSPEGPARLNWIGPNERGQRLGFSPDSREYQQNSAVVDAIEGVLSDCLQRDEFSLLHFYNRERESLRFGDDVVDVLLSGRLEPGRTRWFGYRFHDAFQESSDRFRLTFRGYGGPVGFEVRPGIPPFDEDKLILKNSVIALYLVEDSRPAEWRDKVMHQVERFVGFLLSRAVHPGMRLAQSVQAGGSAQGGGSAPISTSRWGNPLQWHQFFSDFEIERSSICSMRFVDPITWITHGEAECRLVEPEVSPRPVTYTNLPWEEDRQQGNRGSMSLFTNLGEREAVMGGTDKLQQALERAACNTEACFVCMNNTCLPKIIGDDVASAMRRFARTSPIPVLNLNTDLNSPDSSFKDLVRQAKEALGESLPTGERKGLNLVGFPPNRGRRELIAELGEMEIETNAALLPDIGIKLLARYMRGKHAVVYPHASWVEIVESQLTDLDVPFEIMPAPYGFRRSVDWLESVGNLMQCKEQFERFRRERLDEQRRQWEKLTQLACDFRLAFVVDSSSLRRLFEPRPMYGFEILSLLEEMGFGVDVLVLAVDNLVQPDLEEFLPALEHPERHTFKTFSSPEQLADMLTEGSFQAVYSEVFFDSRLTRAGKAQFNLAMLEMGLQGALRGLRRLLAVCRLPFYRRYRRFLGGK